MRLRTAARTLALTAALAAPLAGATSAQAVSARAAVTACPSAATTPSPANVEQLEQTIHCLVNLERTSRGLSRLRGDGKLARAASGHSPAIVRRDFFSHVSPGG